MTLVRKYRFEFCVAVRDVAPKGRSENNTKLNYMFRKKKITRNFHTLCHLNDKQRRFKTAVRHFPIEINDKIEPRSTEITPQIRSSFIPLFIFLQSTSNSSQCDIRPTEFTNQRKTNNIIFNTYGRCHESSSSS